MPGTAGESVNDAQENLLQDQCRRVRKTAFSGFTNGTFSITNTTACLYDGWNLVTEPNELNTRHGKDRGSGAETGGGEWYPCRDMLPR